MRYSKILVENRRSEPNPPLFDAPLGVIPFQFSRDFWRQKYRVSGLSYDTVCVILGLVVFVELRLVTDGRIDRQTQDDGMYCASIASRGKKCPFS